jgi:hypothetical protein
MAEAESESAEKAKDIVAIRTVGRVNAVGPTLVSIAAPTGVSQRITMTSETVVAWGALGTPEDVRAGDRIIVKNRPGTQEAIEIIVLPPESPHGLLVVDVAPDSATIKSLAGEPVTLNIAGARIDTTTVATVSDITNGSTIFAQVKLAGAGKWNAVEIIVLPDGTTFGT